jgi:hypothetical protein
MRGREGVHFPARARRGAARTYPWRGCRRSPGRLSAREKSQHRTQPCPPRTSAPAPAAPPIRRPTARPRRWARPRRGARAPARRGRRRHAGAARSLLVRLMRRWSRRLRRSTRPETADGTRACGAHTAPLRDTAARRGKGRWGGGGQGKAAGPGEGSRFGRTLWAHAENGGRGLRGRTGLVRNVGVPASGWEGGALGGRIAP